MKSIHPKLLAFVLTLLLLSFLSYNSEGKTFSSPATGLIIDGDLLHAASGAGLIGIVYCRSGKIYYNQLSSDGIWQEETLLGPGSEARLILDAESKPHVVFTTATSPSNIAYMKFDGTLWDSTDILSLHGGACTKPSLAIDGNGYAHISYSDRLGNTGGQQDKDDIMYATNVSGSFTKTLIFTGYYENLGGSSYYGEYYNKGSHIAVNSNGDYFIAAHYQLFDRSSGGKAYLDFNIKLHSNLGTGSISPSSASDIFDIFDFKSSGSKVSLLYRQTGFKLSELSISGTVISLVNTKDVVATSVSSFQSKGNNIVISGKTTTKLFTQHNDLSHVYENVVVKNAAVSTVEVGGVFYIVYTDNADGKIKVREVAEPISFTSFEFDQQAAAAELNGQAGTIAIRLKAGADPKALKAKFASTNDVTAINIGGVPQVSGITVNDFSNPLTYNLSDGASDRNWVVNVQEAIQTSVAVAICEGDVYEFGSQMLTTTGTYVGVFTASDGFDSTVTLSLIVNKVYNENKNFTICAGDLPYTFGSQQLTQDGTYTETFQTIHGCDSAVTLVLTVNPVYNENKNLTICAGELPYIFGTQQLTKSGTYTENFLTIHGCDSIVTLNLTVHPSYNGQIPDLEHVVAFYPFNGNANDESGNLNHGTVYGATPTTDRYGNLNQAYSFDGVSDYISCLQPGPVGTTPRTISFWAKIGAIGNDKSNVIISYGGHPGSFSYGDRIEIGLTSAGLTAGVGGTRLVREFDNSDNDWHFYAIVYDGTTTKIQDFKLYADGQLLSKTIQNVDHGHTINTGSGYPIMIGNLNNINRYFKGELDEIKIFDKAFSEEEIQKEFNSGLYEEITICASDAPYIFGGQVLTKSGTYSETFQTIHGCDSVVSLKLKIKTVDVSVIQNRNLLTAQATIAAYQWLDCNNGNTPIAGETNQSYMADKNGNYAVEVTQDGCVEISACYLINAVGFMESIFEQIIKVYPNPCDGKFTIDMGIEVPEMDVTVSNIYGQAVQRVNFKNQQLLDIELFEGKGLYFITLKSNKNQTILKVIKK